jgi:hypothetical protein
MPCFFFAKRSYAMFDMHLLKILAFFIDVNVLVLSLVKSSVF